jgi:hypothetical protein
MLVVRYITTAYDNSLSLCCMRYIQKILINVIRTGKTILYQFIFHYTSLNYNPYEKNNNEFLIFKGNSYSYIKYQLRIINNLVIATNIEK